MFWMLRTISRNEGQLLHSATCTTVFRKRSSAREILKNTSSKMSGRDMILASPTAYRMHCGCDSLTCHNMEVMRSRVIQFVAHFIKLVRMYILWELGQSGYWCIVLLRQAENKNKKFRKQRLSPNPGGVNLHYTWVFFHGIGSSAFGHQSNIQWDKSNNQSMNNI